MIGLIIPCAIAVVLFLFLLLLFATSGKSLTDQNFLEEKNEFPIRGAKTPRPPDFVQRLFSREDWEFVASLRSDPLLRIFKKERKAVGLQWVRGIAAEISRAMQEHTRAARRSADLRVAGELQLFYRFAGLRILCGLLVILIGFVDLPTLLNVATRASKLSEDFLKAQPELKVESGTTPSTALDT
jgi:hypothetical protein